MKPHTQQKMKQKKQNVQMLSRASDAIYSYSAGKLLPGKHLSLGFAMKAFTRSKNVAMLIIDPDIKPVKLFVNSYVIESNNK